jgi:DNA-binding transcriptional MerR regulator
MISVVKTPSVYYNIDTLAQKTGLTRRTIRYYVQRGLLPRPEGGGRGHYYTEEHLARVEVLQRWRSQGVPLEKMKELLSGEPIASAAPAIAEAPSTKLEVSHWIRVSIRPDVELSFKPGTLSREDEEAIKKLILSRIRK